MSNPLQNGIIINSRTVAMIVGIISIIGVMFAVFDKVNSYDYRLKSLEISEENRSKEISILGQELKTLNLRITELTIEIREMRAVERANTAVNR